MGTVYCYEDGSNTVVISTANNKIYYGTTTLTEITGTITTPTADNWKFESWIDASGNTKIVGFQAGHTPIISTVSGATPGNFADMSGTGLPAGSTCLVAFGRIWGVDADGHTINGSKVLDETDWNVSNYSFDTASYWPGNGGDRITALAVWEKKLVVFGRESILIYDNAYNTSEFTISDSIEGVGCVSRDSVQAVGQDIVFLSDTGLRSLRRSIHGGSIPEQEIGNQIRDTLVPYIIGNETTIKSVYSPKEGFYLLRIYQDYDRIFMFDFKGIKGRTATGEVILDLDNVRVSTWEGWNAKAFDYGWDGNIYAAFRDSNDSDNAILGNYAGYLDDTSTYQFRYRSTWFDMTVLAPELGSSLKVPKAMRIQTVGGIGYTLSTYWAFDYSSIEHTGSVSIAGSAAAAAEWGEAEWNEDSWGFGTDATIGDYKQHLTSFGDTVRLGVEVTINNTNFGLQSIEMYFKKGRIHT
jgi:hypothetical protein